MKRRLLLAAAAITVMVIGLVIALHVYDGPKSAVNIRAAKKIHQGMTEQEVVALLGAPPGEYYTDAARAHEYVLYDYIQIGIGEDGVVPISLWSFGSKKKWQTDEGELFVSFDKEGKVVWAFGYLRRPPNWLERIWYWFQPPPRSRWAPGCRAKSGQIAACRLTSNRLFGGEWSFPWRGVAFSTEICHCPPRARLGGEGVGIDVSRGSWRKPWLT